VLGDGRGWLEALVADDAEGGGETWASRSAFGSEVYRICRYAPVPVAEATSRVC
jgi:hypothetical protein